MIILQILGIVAGIALSIIYIGVVSYVIGYCYQDGKNNANSKGD